MNLVRPVARAAVAALVLVVALAACEPVPVRYRDDVFNGVTRTDGITYGRAVDQLGQTKVLALDLYEPAGDPLAARPLVIWVHGGGFSSGNRTSPEIVDQANVFAKKGFVSASISYRLAPVSCITSLASCVVAMNQAAEDARAAVRFFRANAAKYRIDPTRIAIAGTSAGAITALNLAYGLGSEGTSGTPGVSSDVRAAVSLSGAIYLPGYIDPTDDPTLLFHGTNDLLVPYALAKAASDKAVATGLTSQLVTWIGDGHVPYLTHRDEILETTRGFLVRTLALG